MSFNLNVENYTKEELIEMFDLPTNFDRNILEIKESKLKDSIMNNKQINKETIVKTINFLTKAKNIILNEQKPQNKELQQKIQDFYNSSYELKSSKLDDPTEHMIQLRDEKPYLSSYPSEFFPGVINPLKKRTIKKNLNIDTRFRDNYYSTSSTNFNINLPTNFDNVVQLQLTCIELPTTYYTVSKQYGNNFFTINVVDSDGVSNEKIINIQNGNYSQQDIMTYINAQLTSLGAPFSYVSFQINLLNAQNGSGQTIVGPINQSLNPVSSIELNFQNDSFGTPDYNTSLPLKFGWLLGFRNGIYTGNLNYVSEGIVDLYGPRYFYLVVDDYNNNVNNNFYSAFNSSILNKNILARISLMPSQSLSYNSINILEQNNLNLVSTPREYFGPVNLQTMTVQLLDEYGRIVNLNNMDFSFCMTLTTVYDL
jgi:hypothetical protein